MSELHSWKPATFKELLVTGKTHRHILNNLYDILVIEKEVKPLELLEPHERQGIWDEAYRLIKARLPKMGCIEVSKAIYILNKLS
jgi:hypothetical protein